MTRPFQGYHDFLPCDLDLAVWLLKKWHCPCFCIISIRVSYCTWTFLVMRFSYWYQDIWISLWPWSSLELANIVGICISQTHLVSVRNSNIMLCFRLTWAKGSSEIFFWSKSECRRRHCRHRKFSMVSTSVHNAPLFHVGSVYFKWRTTYFSKGKW